MPDYFHPSSRSEVPMSVISTHSQAIIGEPEVVEDDTRSLSLSKGIETSAAWLQVKDAAIALRPLQIKDGSVPEAADHESAAQHVAAIIAGIRALAPAFPHDAEYLEALVVDFERWVDGGFAEP